LEHFRLEGSRIGRLTARRTRFYGITRLSELHASKPALFTSAMFLGRVDLQEAQFEGGISFQETTFNEEVAFRGASVSIFIDLNTTAPQRQTGTLMITEGTTIKGDTSHWTLSNLPARSTTSGER
jgi:Pentapeptide repeats (9 copies)